MGEALHTKFFTTPTSMFTLLKLADPSFRASPWSFIHGVVDDYSKRLPEGTVDAKLSAGYRTLLCYQYQLTVDGAEDTPSYSNPMLLSNVRESLLRNEVDSEAVTVELGRDILLLQMVLYLTADEFQSLFKEIVHHLKNQDEPAIQSSCSAIEILLDAGMLISRVSRKTEPLEVPGDLEDLLGTWFHLIDESNTQHWRSFVLLLVKAIPASPPLIPKLWEIIADYTRRHTESKSLALLCSIIEDFLSQSSAEALSTNTKYCMDERILRLLSDNLASSSQQCRKQGQFILRRLVDHLRTISKTISYMENQVQPPFIDSACATEDLKNNYFLMLESLEEKQAHLVLPAMTHLESLVAALSRGSPSNRIWLRCIFTRLLTHDNSTVIKDTLTTLLQMDLQIFDDGFISLVIQTLNSTFLYEDQSPDPHPRLLREVSQLIIKAERSGVNFTRKFITAASRINWTPIPLLYVLEALGNNQKPEMVHNVWEAEELSALLVIAESYVNKQIRIMKIPMQTNVLRCIMLYAKAPLDLLLLGRIFSAIDGEDVLIRGNHNWELLIEYLRKSVQESSAVEWLSDCCQRLSRNEIDDRDIRALATLTVLIYDTGSVSLKAAITKILSTLFGPIVNAYKRTYADATLFLKAFRLMGSLVKLSPGLDDTYIMMMLGFSASIADFIRTSFRTNWPQSYEAAVVHVDTLSAILTIQALTHSPKGVVGMLGDDDIELIVDTIFDESTPVVQSWYALSILHSTSRCHPSVFSKAPWFAGNADGRIISECYGLLAKIYEGHHATYLTSHNSKEFLSKMMILAESKSDQAIPSVCAILRSMLSTVIKEHAELEMVKEIIQVCWKHFWDMSRTAAFWAAAKGLVDLLLCRDLLESDILRQFSMQKVSDVISKTGNTSALRYILFKRMESVESLIHFHDSILMSFLQADAGKINKRIEMQACCYILKRYNTEVNGVEIAKIGSGLGAYTDVVIRATLVELIVKMGKHWPEELAEAYAPKITSMWDKQRNKRYFGNSNVHRVRHRMMQVLLLIRNDAMYDHLTHSILWESDQPSVRIMKEWIVILFYLRNPTMKDRIWELFSAAESRPGGLTSLVSIVYHVALNLQNDRLGYVRRAVEHILPTCFSQQFIVRLYSQVILSKFLEMMRSDQRHQQSQEYEMISKAVEESLRHGNLMTNSVKLLDNFYFKAFSPQDHLTLQTIFHELPRLTNVCMDEWIRPEVFGLLRVDRGDPNVEIYNDDGRLREVESQESREEETSQAEVCALADIQKKIVPVIPEVANAKSTSTISVREKMIRDDTGLIVIASLVESLPNLGGLARTAEIFCTRELVIKSRHYAENKDFQSLSVTAEKWIAISEVRPHELREYLIERKAAGWKLVGAEQTVNSVNLLDMKFDERTILLLGNEKNGIPANLIQLMDACVEIPQIGVVRSLNVHVTGAICMWQYAQQHLFPSHHL